MTQSKPLRIETSAGKVSAILNVPKKAFAGLTLAHGAGAGMEHPFMSKLAEALSSAGFAVLRFQFPYMEKGQRRPDRPDVAAATVAAAIETLRLQMAQSAATEIPLFAGGKSFGARMSTTAAAKGLLPSLKGIICFGFPLHPAGKPSTQRAEHLAKVGCPMMFLQGTRDGLADLALIRGVCKKLPRATLHVIEGADHGFDVLKRSGRTPDQVIDELAEKAAEFARDYLK